MTAVAQAKPRPGGRPTTAPHVVGFVFHLELKRRELGLGMGEFAEERLGVSRGDYYLMRHGKTRPTMHVMKRALDLWGKEEFGDEVAEAVQRWGE